MSFSNARVSAAAAASLALVSMNPDTMAPQNLPNVFPIDFYRYRPREARALFSTCCGSLPMRELPNPLPLAIVHSDLLDDVLARAKSLRRRFPDLIYNVIRPKQWDELFIYFDAVDIFVEGATFCLYVLDRIVEINAELRNDIENFAREWVRANEVTVRSGGLQVPPLDIFNEADRANLYGMTAPELEILTISLNKYRQALIMKWQGHERQPNPQGACSLQGIRVVPVPSQILIHNSMLERSNAIPVVYEGFIEDQNFTERGLRTYPNAPVKCGHVSPRDDFRSLQCNNTRSRWALHPVETTPLRHKPTVEPSYILKGQRETPTEDLTKHYPTSSSSTDRAFGRRIWSKPQDIQIEHRYASSSDNAHGFPALSPPFKNNTNAKTFANYSCTYFYTGTPRPLSQEDTNSTVYVSGIDQRIFETHKLKDMMSKCGEVQHIHYLYPKHKKYGGQAFVAFKSETSVKKAIDRYNNHKLESYTLTVNMPYGSRKLGRDLTRASSLQQYSNCSGHFQTSRSNLGRQSLAHSPHARSARGTHVSSPVSLTTRYQIQLAAATTAPDILVPSKALNGLETAKPPSDNIHPSAKVTPGNKSSPATLATTTSTALGQMNQKENLPMKTSGITPFKIAPVCRSRDGGESKKKGNKGFDQPSPNVTPTKSVDGTTLNNGKTASVSISKNKSNKVGNEFKSRKPSQVSRKTKTNTTSNGIGHLTANCISAYGHADSDKSSSINTDYSISMTTTSDSSLTTGTEAESLRVTRQKGLSSNCNFSPPIESPATKSNTKSSDIQRETTRNPVKPNTKNVKYSKKQKTSGNDSAGKTDATKKGNNGLANLGIRPPANQNHKNLANYHSSGYETFEDTAANSGADPLIGTESAAEADLEASEDGIGVLCIKDSINLDDRDQFPAIRPVRSLTSGIVDRMRPAHVAFRQPHPAMGLTSPRQFPATAGI